MDLLVSTEWLAAELGADDLVVVDATYLLPGSGRDLAVEYDAAHIAGARWLDLETLVDPGSSLPNTLPSPELFAIRATALGIGADDRIVLYDNSALHSAARAWWMFRFFGARQVAILDGGLAKWRAEERPVESGRPVVHAQPFAAQIDADALRSKAQMLDLVGTNDAQIVDARSPGRFTAEELEPRADMASGHIPGSRNLHYSRLFNADGTWKRGDALRAAFAEAGIDLDAPIAATCGSGVTAAIVLFAATLLGATQLSLYDGSWSEWGADPATPKATGPAA